MNTYYQSGPKRGAQVHTLFSRIAPRYDLINDLQSIGLHRLWKNRVKDLALAGTGTSVLDVCAGTGDISIRLAHAGARVIALDFNRAMLEIANSRASASGVHCSLVNGDAENLPFPAETFEAVTIGYGLRNLPNWQTGLAELYRVTLAGGRIVILDFGKPPTLWWKKIFFTYLRAAVPLFGKLFAGDWNAYAYILASLEAYPSHNEISAFLKRLGCQQVDCHLILGGAMTIHRAIR